MSSLPQHQVQVIFKSNDSRVPTTINLILIGYWVLEGDQREVFLLRVFNLKDEISKITDIPQALLELDYGLDDDFLPLHLAVTEDSQLKHYYDNLIIDSLNTKPTFIITVTLDKSYVQEKIDGLIKGLNWIEK